MQKIDAILPMIADSVNQCEWYVNGNTLKSTDDIQLNNILYSYGTEEIHDYLDPDYRLAYARNLVEEIESWKEQLQGAAKSFTIMRERARTLRYGVRGSRVLVQTYDTHSFADICSHERKISPGKPNTRRECQASDLCHCLLPTIGILHGEFFTSFYHPANNSSICKH